MAFWTTGNFIPLYIADVVTPEEQEQVFAASVHNLSKLAAILLKECTGTRN